MRRGRHLAAMAAFVAWGAVLLAENDVTTAVYAQTEKGYRRTKAADGSFEREYYVMSNAGKLPGTLQDMPQRKLPFARLAGILAEHLAKQGYFPAAETAKAQLLLVVHWGTTIPFSDSNYAQRLNAAGGSFARLQVVRREGDGGATRQGFNPANPLGGGEAGMGTDPEYVVAEDFEQEMMMLMMENKDRDRANEKNARLLGYIREINEANGIQRWAGGGTYYDDLRADIEEPRYYVVISAYDFAKTVKDKQAKLLWVTRVSIRAPGNGFEEHLATMLRSAARQFGRESGRLVRQFETNTGTVEVGPSTVIGTISEEAVKQRSERKKARDPVAK